VLLAGSAILTEELAPVVGGFAAEQGHIGFIRGVLACALGVWSASMALYGVGRYNAASVRLLLRRSAKAVRRLLPRMRARPWRTSILSRVAFGARIALPLACGAAHVHAGVYAAGTAIGALVWSAAFATLGWFFGESAVLVLGSVRRYENILLIVLVVAGIAAFFAIRRRQRRADGV
jgi:membrane protein DedA with SNARE-associated domain